MEGWCSTSTSPAWRWGAARRSSSARGSTTPRLPSWMPTRCCASSSTPPTCCRRRWSWWWSRLSCLPTRFVACPPTARCTFASPMRCATVADPTRMPVWSDWKHGRRRWRSGDRPAGARHPAGLLLGGGFGSGKSHLLEHLAQLALDAGFVVGRVVVSKETPLYDPVKVFRAAAASAVVPGGHGPALVEAAASLDPGTPAHGDLWRWVSAQGAGLNERFAATLLLFDRLGATDGELADAIVRFWSGDPIKVAEVRRRLRETGEARYPLPAVPARELARQRFRFATRLMVAAGYSGWLVLFDEVELIGRYSVLQRGRCYAELVRWVRGAHDDPGLPLVAVLAMTDDFEAAVLSGKNDREVVPSK